METKDSENTVKKEKLETKVPISAKFHTTKGKSSVVPVKKKTTVQLAGLSSKEKECQIAPLQKKVKPMSVIKMSKDIMNCIETENLEPNDQINLNAHCDPLLGKENTTKLVSLKENTRKSQPGCLPKRPSVPDLKKGATFGGIKLIPKKTTGQMFAFEKMKKDSKRLTLCPTDQTSDNAVCDPLIGKGNTMKRVPLTENSQPQFGSLSKMPSAPDLKKDAVSGGINRITKKRTGRNLEAIEKIKKELKVQSLRPAESISKGTKTISVKPIINKDKEQLVLGNVAPTDEKKSSKPTLHTQKAGAALRGINLTKKNTGQKPDPLEKIKEMRRQTLRPTEIVNKGIKTTDTTKIIVNKNIQRLILENVQITPTDERETAKPTSHTQKELVFKTPKGLKDISFVPKWNSTPLQPDLLKNKKEVELEDKEIFTTVSPFEYQEDSPDFLKASTRGKTETGTVQSPSKQTELLTTTIVNETVHRAAHGGIRFTPKKHSTPVRPFLFNNMQKERL